ncbi:MAG: class I SAM-dependent methyltransferase [Myxococcales bacterium]|nr:class I SAM-dependent methyltransferase [Myxococcales bacterium]
MLPFWLDVLEPTLRLLEPRLVVEIGSESGKCTHRILELTADWGGRVEAIDPAPLFDVDAWLDRWGERFVLHQAPSLEVIGSLEAPDAVMIDGDHNWYTVFHELSEIEERMGELGAAMPLIFLHDISWPYGRRDLYYAPEMIPADQRQPFARKGISPTSSELLEEGGFNRHLCNADHEGGPRNGVLTAVEDYLDKSAHRFRFVRIPAAFGLGILLPEALAVKRPALAEAIDVWKAPMVERFIDRLETARIAMLTGLAAVPR